MKSVFRLTVPDDLPVLREFLARAFGISVDTPAFDPALMTWKYWAPRGDWAEPRSYVLEAGGKITAHAGIWPRMVGEARGIQMIDWAAAKEAPGAGLSLVQKLAAMCDFMYSVGGSEMTRKVLPAFGFAEYTRQWNGAVPLRPLRQILTHQNRGWKLAPRLVRNWLWSRAGVKAKGEAAAYRPEEPFLEYLSRCPAAKFRFYRFDKGRFAISVVRGQARVAGVWLDESTTENWTEAFALARQVADGNELIAAGSDSMTREAAGRAGFHITPGAPVFLLDRKKKFAPPAGFQFQLCDDDAAFLDTGSEAYWT
ncbi:MAG TPA: hypothetical protein VEF06_11560 [Bryobacteraceae bacterium]|nr:hypothetical protein [Bryobacteraceae bacterium]